jgi:hypothetical protein
MHLTPAGLPSGIPGIMDEIERAIQHAPHPVRHSMFGSLEFDGKYIKILLVRLLYAVFDIRHSTFTLHLEA